MPPGLLAASPPESHNLRSLTLRLLQNSVRPVEMSLAAALILADVHPPAREFSQLAGRNPAFRMGIPEASAPTWPGTRRQAHALLRQRRPERLYGGTPGLDCRMNLCLTGQTLPVAGSFRIRQDELLSPATHRQSSYRPNSI